ncbi:Fur-regulated basic protein FbpA [Bacillus timonensis]|uniref:Fur-regulated basic protein FbpA n=1 Tax=Bacillus timonensis TaxID=1033734 RepID=UPI000289607D|nr:Fur-regulated basic protein FbpA [Bacillus timonensis]
MGTFLRYAVQVKKKDLINKLIKRGIYKKNDKHLYELTLSELEKEYEVYDVTNDLVAISEERSNP